MLLDLKMLSKGATYTRLPRSLIGPLLNYTLKRSNASKDLSVFLRKSWVSLIHSRVIQSTCRVYMYSLPASPYFTVPLHKRDFPSVLIGKQLTFNFFFHLPHIRVQSINCGLSQDYDSRYRRIHHLPLVNRYLQHLARVIQLRSLGIGF